MSTKQEVNEITLARTINYALYSSEYQSAIEVSRLLSKVVSTIYTDAINKRVYDLLVKARSELLLCFNVVVNDTQLATTPIYSDADMEQLTDEYLLNLAEEEMTTKLDETKYLQRLAIVRRNDSMLYTFNAPIQRVLAFLKHPEYKALMESEEMTDERFRKIHDTLLMVFLTPANEFKAKLNIALDTDLFDKDTIDTLEILTDTIV